MRVFYIICDLVFQISSRDYRRRDSLLWVVSARSPPRAAMSPVLRIAVIGNAYRDPAVATTPFEALPPYSIAVVRDSYD